LKERGGEKKVGRKVVAEKWNLLGGEVRASMGGGDFLAEKKREDSQKAGTARITRG